VTIVLHPGITASPNHHGSHRDLLTVVDVVAEPAAVDAIIVPTARPTPYLRTAIALAKLQRCPVVVLCSHRASAGAAMNMAARVNAEIIAIDVAHLRGDLLPQFRTTEVLQGTRFSRNTDTSQKRNLGLLLAQVVGWNRIVFLDDDITVPFAEDLNAAAGLVDSYAAVGLSIGGFPDNSVVCHAFRDLGGRQDTFIGGGALAVGRQSFTSFFPNIYNEDWFFLLDETELKPSAVTGRVIQAAYDPYRDTVRARAEELGDCLAEGLWWLLDNGQPLTAATHSYWREFLSKRRRFIDEVLGMAGSAALTGNQKALITEALKASKGRNLLIDPAMCVNYMRAWSADRELWQLHVEKLGRLYSHFGKEKLLAKLGLMHGYRAAA
jgi:hypothetical protein